ncbi:MULTISPECIES: NAD(P)/FAD-dependent oxidoreductase [unclassified Devosia]|uniref:flavin-containing monooxygenase n=1 Tax=unclassified Devosia TaxID=196773 RepID=UPI00145E5C17|nr:MULTISPECIES: NAD(P)/FAD-dependent oxidoreductase [unclassified Devosia]MBJ6988070.1 NAD(P)-binding domain-containing protein [Devosia sp. MC521]MBJ7577641.1 NAD(P)-binding domain-containing protein [Devosia sp. MC532]QMW63359.1 NAD(P)-binding domain-containing protein [Devosia sp. MC521]
MEKVNTIVVGGGQAGISMSEHLTNLGISHVVLEKGRVAESWRTARWDSLRANGPAWHDRLPSSKIESVPQDVFTPKDKLVEYLVEHAERNNAPIRTGVSVISVTKLHKKQGYHVVTSDGEYEAINVVAATGAFQTPVYPKMVPEDAPVMQIHSVNYRNPDQLPEGAVLVVGAGASGGQIAEELVAAGRKVYHSIGRHIRPPRFYRDREGAYWTGVLGRWDTVNRDVKRNIALAISGVHTKMPIDYRLLASKGAVLVGRTASYENGKLTFSNDLADNIEFGNNSYLDTLNVIDAYIENNGLDLPEYPEARNLLPTTEYETNPILELDLAEAGITSIIWASGFKRDYSWLQVDTFEEDGTPIHDMGVGKQPGIYFLGLPFQTRRRSSFLFGVWYDAKYVGDYIAMMQKYHDKYNV